MPGQVLITEKKVLESQEKLLANVRPLLGQNVGQAMQGGFQIQDFEVKGVKEDSLHCFRFYIFFTLV